MSKPIVALMYDFDKTLSPKNMQDYGFMDGLGMSAGEFWSACTDSHTKIIWTASCLTCI